MEPGWVQTLAHELGLTVVRTEAGRELTAGEFEMRSKVVAFNFF